MLLPQVEYLDDIQDTHAYQEQLKAVYKVISNNQYQQLTVIIDLNTYGTAVFAVLDNGTNLPFERIKRIHHTFKDDLALIDIQLNSSTDQRLLEQLLALSVYENSNDVSGHPHPRSVYLMGQAYGLGSNKKRYLRYWDPRVLALMTHIWTAEQKLQIHQLGLIHIYYIDWNNEMTVLTLPTPNEVYPADTQKALEQLKSLPFRFSQQQWSLLEQIEWMNMIVRQLKEQVMITDRVYEVVLSNATSMRSNYHGRIKATTKIVNELSN
ncbi:hypothetical protein [Psychrobacter sp.]|uniref:hypothetical protein n=1 Tax=Psychrobacter sp. TaxID=56811 RepID=UPI003F9ADB58